MEWTRRSIVRCKNQSKYMPVKLCGRWLLISNINTQYHAAWKRKCNIKRALRWGWWDLIIWPVKIKTSKRYLERPIKLLHTLKLSWNNECNINKSNNHNPVEVSNKDNGIKMNINTPELSFNENQGC